ncbi:MAG: exodeoxyribonuclease VII small subunit [Anaerolineales bacterium]|jgi:exodeoxyribonuclease VII small subunit
MAKAKAVDELTYEQAFEELQVVVERLEAGDLPLEESLALFERGQALSARCSDLLEQAQLRLTELTEGAGGEIAERDIEVDES